LDSVAIGEGVLDIDGSIQNFKFKLGHTEYRAALQYIFKEIGFPQDEKEF